MLNLKNIVLTIGTKFIDLMVILLFISIVVLSIICMVKASFLYGLLSLIFGSISLVMSTFFIYIFIDMRDSLLKIANAKNDPSNQN